MLSNLPIKIGVSPLNWWPGFPIPDTLKPSPDQVLREIKECGYAGTELGGPLPSAPEDLGPLLEKHELELIGGWFGSLLLSKPLAEEKQRYVEFVASLKQMGASLVIIGEVTHVPVGLPYADSPHRDVLTENLFPYPLPVLRDHEWTTLAQGLEEFCDLAAAQNLRVAYHPHMLTLIQDQWQIERLMEEAPFLTYCLDTGHLAFAGVNPAEFIAKHMDKTIHLHLKNIRREVIARAHREPMPWIWAKIEGVFTVPGDGGLDFLPIFETMRKAEYEGWVVLEAEQNPLTANPSLYATLGREYLREVIGL